jgi:DNA-binding transcriptional regulator YhcF (GntR family)
MYIGGGEGVIILMDKYAIIKLKLEGHSNRKLAKMLGINRKTIGKYWNEYNDQMVLLSSSEVDSKEIQEKICSDPVYDSSNRKSRKYTDEMDQFLDEILEDEKEKCKVLGANKQQLTQLQIYELIIKEGFEISQSTITNKIREKRNKTKECFIKQDYDYGDRLEYDFGEIKLVIDGILGTYHIAVLSSPGGGFRWAYLYKNQKQDVFLDSHVRFFELVKGVYKEVVYDNMKNVVTRFIGRNEKELNKELLKLSLYYGFDINVTNCYKGNEKGHVEGSVKIIRNKVFALHYKFKTFEDAEEFLNNELIKLSSKSKISEEVNHLLPYKPKLELADIAPLKVNKYSFIQTGNNFYSVPEYLVGKMVTAKIYYDKILIFSNNHFVCEHKKIDGSHEITYHPLNEKKINYKQEHYENLMKGKVKDTDMGERITENLRIMDSLLDMRKVVVSSIDATNSADALITYINQNSCVKWVINNYAHLSASDKLVFIRDESL